MSITITDPALLAQITQASGVVDLKDPTGKVLGRLHVETPGKLPPGFKIPFTDEQLAEFSKQRTGRPIGDVLKELQEKYGE
jgi:hypothetical protein